MGKRERILVIKLGALGDFIQAMGPMAAIRRHHPDSDITLLTTDPFVGFATHCGYFNHIWTDGRPRLNEIGEWVSLWKKLNSGQFSRVYDLQNNDRTALYLHLFRKKPEWVGAARGASHRNASPGRTAGQAFDGHAQTLALAGIKDVMIDDLSWVQGNITRYNLPEKFVLLAPGSAPDRPEKRWSSRNYGMLARTLDGWGTTPVVIGTLQEQNLAAAIKVMHPGAIDLCGQTSLFDIVLLARQAAAAIGNDTGPMHLIGATGCPAWVIFSCHSNPQRHAPKGSNIHIISKDNLDHLTPDECLASLHMRQFKG